MHLREELEKRWFLYQVTNEDVFDIFNEWWQSFYFGVDPTADSLHLGNFVVFMQAVNYMKRGNKLYLIVGGATGMIGDPGGKNSERSFLDDTTLQHNIESITQQVWHILQNLKTLSWYDFDFEVLNNEEFYTNMKYTQFLRDVGKYVTVNNMINKETVKKRVENPKQSISYTEFSYMLMQAYDYLRLYQDKNVTLQISWSDQRWNIVTGVELIRKKLDKQAYGATWPLVVDATGKKFGKSEGNALWLNPQKNSPFVIYQYFLNANDDDVERYLKLLTLLDFPTIQNIIQKHETNPADRHGQTQLAQYVTETVFGQHAASQAAKITDLLFTNDKRIETLKGLDENEQHMLLQATHGKQLTKQSYKILDLCTQSELTSSNSETKKLIQSWALYCNEEQITDSQFEITTNKAINTMILLRKWKKTFKAIQFI